MKTYCNPMKLNKKFLFMGVFGSGWKVSYLYGVQGVASSNPAAPTNIFVFAFE